MTAQETTTTVEGFQHKVIQHKIIRPKIFFDMKIANKKAGRLIVELHSDFVPRTAENFRSLCVGDEGKVPGLWCDGAKMHFKGSKFFRIIPNYLIQEKHNKPGLLSMADLGPRVVGSQFFITLKPIKAFDNKHVVVGHVVEGMDIIKEIENKGSMSGKPQCVVKIAKSGEMPEGE